MKKLNNFLEKAPLWQIYIFGFFVTGSMTTSIFYGIQFIAETGELDFSLKAYIIFGTIMGTLFGLIITLIFSMFRKSQIFWEYSTKVVENLIEKAKTKDELQSIFENQFQELRKKCQGGPQISELRRLYTIIETKSKYIE